MTQLQSALAGRVTPAMEQVAHDENLPAETVREAVASGRAVIPLNPAHRGATPVGVGRMFRTKVNANLGRSPTRSERGGELDKLRVALAAGADFVMDLSVGPDLRNIRQGMLEASALPLGTVPVYETIARLEGSEEIPVLDVDLLLKVIREQAEQGVDFMTLHAGLLRAHIPHALKRIMGIVSRGGAIMAEWMQQHRAENPLYTRWDEVLEILVEHDVTVSLGDGLRPGCLADASDAAQFSELDTLGELVRRTRARGVQVMVEGPGHLPFDQIQENMERQQRICDGAPFYVLGPVVTDIGAGYDHLVAAIGATAATVHGASLLCYVTPSEHLRLPTIEDVREGVIASKIAAHAGDIAKGNRRALERDLTMAKYRKNLDWEGQIKTALDPERARAMRESSKPSDSEVCTMCGEFCAIKVLNQEENWDI